MSEVFITVLNMSLTASYVAAAVILARLFLKKAPKIFSYALWAVVLFRLLCPFSFESIVSILPIKKEVIQVSVNSDPEYPSAIYSNVSFGSALGAAYHAVGDTLNGGLGTISVSTDSAPSGITFASHLEVWIIFGSYIWLYGIIALILYAVISYIKIKRRVFAATIVRDNIFETDRIKTPFVIGFIKPKIYLPVGLAEKETEYIISHEQTHIKRGDHLIKVLAFIALAVHWFNPLIWLSYFLMAKDMELSCDESVMKRSGEDIRINYSASLLSLSVKQNSLPNPLAFGENNVKARVKNVLNFKKPSRLIVALAVIAVAAIIVGCAANRANPGSQNAENIENDESAANIETLDLYDEETNTITWYADLTHDGIDSIDGINGINEKIVVQLNSYEKTEEEHTISIYDINDSLIWSDKTIENFHVSHNGYYLYKDNDGRYNILNWYPWIGGGGAHYGYEIFSFDSGGNKISHEKDSLAYNTISYSSENNGEDFFETPPVEFREFIDKVNSYLSNSFVIIDTYDFELIYSTPDNRISRLYPAIWKDETESAAPSDESAAVTNVSTINDLNDWEKLGLESAEYWQWHYEYINVFLNKDTERLEFMSATRQKGLYDIYKTLEFGAYTITVPEDEELRYHVLLNVDIVSSGVEGLPVGNYTFRIEEGMVPGHYNHADTDWGGRPSPQTPAQEALNKWFGTCLSYMFYDYNTLSGDSLKWYSYDIMDYLLCSFPEPENGWTLQTVQEYMEKYFGLKDFIPSDNLLERDGTYSIGGHGGEVWFYKFTDETVSDGITTVTIQFFADTSRTIKSHTIEYKMQAVDGGYQFIGSEIIYKSPYEPWHLSV